MGKKVSLPENLKRIVEGLLQKHSIAEPGFLDQIDEEGLKQAISYLPLDERNRLQKELPLLAA